MKRYIIAILLTLPPLCSSATSLQEAPVQEASPQEAPAQETSPQETSLQAVEKKVIKGFCGGMMVHTGYQFGCDNPYGYNAKGATFGIGGAAKLQFTRHFRVGFEGYFSTVGLHNDIKSGSHNKLFWSGALVDWFWKCGRFYPYIGTTIGGGMETAFYMFEGDKHDWLPETKAVFHKQPFFALDPFVGVDFAVGAALRLTLKADWMMAINSNGLNRPLGPRIYFGFIFSH